MCSQNWQSPDYTCGGVIIRFQNWENWHGQLRPIEMCGEVSTEELTSIPKNYDEEKGGRETYLHVYIHLSFGHVCHETRYQQRGEEEVVTK